MKEDKSTDAINKQLGNSFEANDSILSSMSRNARLSKGAMNYSDTMEQGAQINTELVILQQFNLVAYLIVMKEFQEINRIFHSDDRLSHRLSILLEMERELEAKQQQTQYLYAEQERQRLSKNQEQVSQRSHDQDAKHRQLMNELEALRQLQQELQHLRETFYARQNVLYGELATLREEQMDEMLKLARKSADISPKQLTDLEKIHEDTRKRQEQIDKMPTTDANGKPDYRLAQQKVEAQKELHEEHSGKLKNWMHNCRDRNVHACYNNHQVNIDGKKEVIANKERVFKTQAARLEKKISDKLTTTNTTAAQQLAEISKDLTQISRENNFSPEQSETLQREISVLNKYKKDLASSPSVEEQQQLLNACKQTLTKIDQLLAPIAIDSLSYNSFKKEVSQFQKITVIASTAPQQSISKNQGHSSHVPPSMHSSDDNVANGKSFEQYKSKYVAQRFGHNHEENEAVTQFKQSFTEFQGIAELVAGDDLRMEKLQEQASELQNNTPVPPELIESICETCSELSGEYEELQTILDTMKDLSQRISSSEMELEPQGPGRRI
jgi:hypothetical protein